jgi:hypothetical protein
MFSNTARDLRLDGSRVRCQLQHNGNWVDTDVDLNNHFDNNGFGKICSGGTGFWSTLDHSKDRLDGHVFWSACSAGPTNPGTYYDFKIDLDRYFKNKDGRLVFIE